MVVTHQMEVVKQVCNKIAILSKGHLAAKGKVEDIFLDQPAVLEELLGNSHRNQLPSNGVNIEIIEKNDIQKGALLSKMAMDTGVQFQIVWGSTDQYRDRVLGFFVINMESSQREAIVSYLDKNNVEWREV